MIVTALSITATCRGDLLTRVGVLILLLGVGPTFRSGSCPFICCRKVVTEMAEYRKKRGGDTWHWCRNCSKDPKSDYDTKSDRPSWDLCEECKSKEKNGTCQT